jgi:hypothetical protein
MHQTSLVQVNGESGWVEEPEESSKDEGECVVDNAVWEPSNDIKDWVCEVSEDIRMDSRVGRTTV